MSDLIERQVAKNAICNACGKIDCDQMDTCEMLKLPPAQPEKRTQERTETHACDLIDRQAAIDAVDDVPYIKEHPNEGLLWKAWIEQMPSAQPEPHWIPCKERLPEKNGMYFVSTDSDHLPPGYQTTDVITWHDGKWIMADYFVLDEEMRKKPEYRVVEVAIPILAWMPLPEPYKEGES